MVPSAGRERFMLKLDDRADLEGLHTGSIQESLTLEYKSSGAVNKTPSKKEEIAKDASAFANAAGGQIVYSPPGLMKVSIPHSFRDFGSSR
jgi:hypothetical protein